MANAGYPVGRGAALLVELDGAERECEARFEEVVALCELQELSYVEAAAALDCAVGTVRSRLHRARAMLAAKLRERRRLEEAARGEGSQGGETPQTLRTARCFA